MQIGPIKYSSTEELFFFRSIMFGLLLGLPLGIFVDIVFGFQFVPNTSPGSYVEWVTALYTAIGGVIWMPAVVSVALWFFQYQRSKLTLSLHNVGKIAWAFFILFPVLFTYVVLIFAALFVPLIYATPWLSSVKEYWLGALLFFPFLVLFVLIFMPDQKPRRIVAHAWEVINGKAPFPRPKLKGIIGALLILAYLLLVFLPLPDTPVVRLVIIGGGLLVIAFLVRQRLQAKRK